MTLDQAFVPLRRKEVRKVGLALVLVLATVTAVNASLIYDFVTVVPSGPNFIWTYDAHLASDQKVNGSDIGENIDLHQLCAGKLCEGKGDEPGRRNHTQLRRSS
jgi:hypothetical protein